MAFVDWSNLGNLSSKAYTCGYCGKVVASAQGYQGGRSQEPPHTVWVYVCPHCRKPTYFDGESQVPGVAPGVEVQHLPNSIEMLYREARNCVAVGSYTSAVLSCRKLLMNIAVSQGASAGDSFLSYVQFLASKGYVPPHGQGWVDHIRKKANEANHEIVLMSKSDAEDLITFLEMLLKFIYEFPKKVPLPSGKP